MPVLNIHNAVAGCSVLIEYRGTPSAVVLLLPFATTGKRLGDTLVGLVGNQALQPWLNYTLDSLTGDVQMLPVRTVQCDVNGFAHAVVPAAALLSAGDTLRVEATEIA